MECSVFPFFAKTHVLHSRVCLRSLIMCIPAPYLALPKLPCKRVGLLHSPDYRDAPFSVCLSQKATSSSQGHPRSLCKFSGKTNTIWSCLVNQTERCVRMVAAQHCWVSGRLENGRRCQGFRGKLRIFATSNCNRLVEIAGETRLSVVSAGEYCQPFSVFIML